MERIMFMPTLSGSDLDVAMPIMSTSQLYSRTSARRGYRGFDKIKATGLFHVREHRRTDGWRRRRLPNFLGTLNASGQLFPQRLPRSLLKPS